jgi:hypothetical protein
LLFHIFDLLAAELTEPLRPMRADCADIPGIASLF